MLAFLLVVAFSFCVEASERKPGVTAVFTSSNRYDLLKQTLDSFAKYNTYPLQKIIVVQDGILRPNISIALSDYPDIQLIVTGKKVGQIMAIDIAYNQDDWKFLRAGLIQNDIKQLQKDPMLLQMWNRKRPAHYIQNNYVARKMNLKGSIIDARGIGFSLNPAVHNMDLYDKLENGYVGLTNNISYGLGAGNAESKIAQYYNSLGYRVKQIVQDDYILHLGVSGRGLPKKPNKP